MWNYYKGRSPPAAISLRKAILLQLYLHFNSHWSLPVLFFQCLLFNASISTFLFLLQILQSIFWHFSKGIPIQVVSHTAVILLSLVFLNHELKNMTFSFKIFQLLCCQQNKYKLLIVALKISACSSFISYYVPSHNLYSSFNELISPQNCH